MLDPEKYKSVVFDRSSAEDVNMFGQYKWKAGELEFESLMRMLDNLVRALTVWRRQSAPLIKNPEKWSRWMNRHDMSSLCLDF